MGAKPLWMVRAGQGGIWVDEFRDENHVAIGWAWAGDLAPLTSKPEIEARLATGEYKNTSPGTLAVWASQIKRYYDEVKIGDGVVTYDPGQRLYLLGTINSDVTHREHHLRRMRKVIWTKKVPRDTLSSEMRNALGSIATLFQVREEIATNLWNQAIPINSLIETGDQEIGELEDDETQILLDEVATKANDFIEDRIAKLNWEQLQELVAEILFAMGYRARVSPKGADRGCDITASPDGLGLQEPRIFVEVKHRLATQMN